MKVHIIIQQCGSKIGDPPPLQLRSIWNEDDQVELEIGGNKYRFIGSELVDSVRRVIGRPLFQRD